MDSGYDGLDCTFRVGLAEVAWSDELGGSALKTSRSCRCPPGYDRAINLTVIDC